ncbi:hypothetical protein [Hyphomicrobium sp.]|uniref:hypothetical protein n=1 Tax=Hyphomicrobium sp. TaxID=82 RepID=UPI002E2FB607|nr:hypothetical protein [Hyphomicrobium sp.]HEX2841819.1 hypothetical protein [Hyphomicrobium sp.]
MTHRLRGRLGSRKSWSTLLAVLLSTLAGAFAFGPNSTLAGGLSASEHNTDARTTGKPASLRLDVVDPSLSLGGAADPGTDVDTQGREFGPWSGSANSAYPDSATLHIGADRIRDGRTRAPPRA